MAVFQRWEMFKKHKMHVPDNLNVLYLFYVDVSFVNHLYKIAHVSVTCFNICTVVFVRVPTNIY